MKINKYLLIFFLTMAFQPCEAQIQQGYVKTLGRPDKRGEALGGVTIRVKGEHNFVTSEDDGTFTLLLADKKNGDAYSLQQVQKNGYELNENDMIGRQLAFSVKVPLTIVMVSSEQLQADKQRIEENAYKIAEKNYKAKYDLLAMQLANNTIVIEQYREKIQELQDKFEKYQSQIDGLAEHYAHTDYDFLDENDREINLCIENGDLERADSLIHLLFEPIGVIERNKHALADIEKQIGEAKDIIAQANDDMDEVLKQQEKDAEYLYHLYTIALARFDNEKTLHYIEIRAELDSTNPSWQFDAGRFFQEQKDSVNANKFYLRALEIYRRLAKETPQAFEPVLAATLNNLAILYKDNQRFEESEALFNEALEIRRRLSKYTSQSTAALAMTLNNLADLYKDAQRYTESENLHLEALKIRRRLVRNNPKAFKPDLAMTLNNLAILYSKTQRFEESERLYLEALEIRRQLVNDNMQIHAPDLAMTLNNLANLYSDTQRLDESEILYLEALEIYRRLAKENPQAFDSYVVMILKNLAALYSDPQYLTEGVTMHLKALEIIRQLVKDDPQSYESTIVTLLYRIGFLQWQREQYDQAIPYFEEALGLYRSLSLHNSSFEKWYEKTLNWLARLYSMTEEHVKYYEINEERLPLLKNHYQDDADFYRSDLVNALSDQSFQCIFACQLDKSELYAHEALSIDSTRHEVCSKLALALLFQGKYADAELIYIQYKDELKHGFLQDFDDLEAAGVIPENRKSDVEKIKKMLSE